MDQHILIARLNIEHFHRQLTAAAEEPYRQTLLRLLAEEGAKLAALADPPDDRNVS